MKSATLSILLFLFIQTASAQHPLPLIKATSSTVDIRDGKHLKKSYWAIMPERNPDYYYTEIPEQSHTVTFITDQDSISFDMTYGREVDFIILLNGKDSCLPRISANYRNITTFIRKQVVAGPDTIPFTVGDNSKVYIKGTINGSQMLDMQLDLGAGGSVIKKASVVKVKMNFDQTVTLHNSDGSNQAPSASSNLVQIGNLVWDSVSVVVANNMTNREDVIVGNSLFRGKVMEINYDKLILIIHDSLPSYAATYLQNDVVLDGGIIPFIQVSLTRPGHTNAGWAMFDTGAYTSILNSEDVPGAYRIWGELMQLIGFDRNKYGPWLRFGNHEFSGFNYNVRNMGGNGLHMILGNDLLNRFNMILDNRGGYLYLQPNSRMQALHGKRGEYSLVKTVVLFVCFMAGVVGIIIYRRRRRKSVKARK